MSQGRSEFMQRSHSTTVDSASGIVSSAEVWRKEDSPIQDHTTVRVALHLRSAACIFLISSLVATVVDAAEFRQVGSPHSMVSGYLLAGIGGAILVAVMITCIAYVVDLLQFIKRNSGPS